MFSVKMISTALVLGLVSGAASAQDYSDAELLNLFQSQRDAFSAAGSNGLGKTRGLTLVTIEDIAVSTETDTLVAPDPGGANTAIANAGGTGNNTTTLAPSLGQPSTGDAVIVAGTDTAVQPVAPNTTLAVVKPVVFGKLVPELQINVRIEFAFDSAALGNDQAPKLTQLCRVMKASDIAVFRIAGHTDSSGSDDYNEKLSLLRAEEVRRFLVNDCGLAGNRLEAIGLGERFPFDENNPRADGNRRVEFQALS